ncbi:MAG: prepilin-type N-terminal cleavage/methylation domain-containing protein [Candidatus Omnitrophica bacterium]|nr:prepilin-type N-terminal cleavage/methylation domain-containing protein [Candidatus Omnitrophota bacterium]
MSGRRLTLTGRRSGFTLIELLIVIAIILILIAIALPNFLAAMTRAKVTREKTDMRTISVAIESLRADRGVLLVDFWDDDSSRIIQARFGFNGVNMATNETPTFFTCCSHQKHNFRGGTSGIFAPLTTPVPYITEVPRDPFEFNGDVACLIEEDVIAPISYQYVDNEFEDQVLDRTPQTQPIGVFGCWRAGSCPPGARGIEKPLGRDQYLLVGFGPDGERCDGYDLPYSPTNGSDSSGDVLYVSTGLHP